jgi:MFS family permease
VALVTEIIILYPAGAAADRLGRKPVLTWSLLALALAISAVGLAGNVAMFVVLLGLVGFASGAAGVVPTAMLSDVAPTERSGTAVGIYRSFGDLGFVFGPLAAGWTAEHLGLGLSFPVMVAPLAVAFLLVLATPETLARRPGGTQLS